jgi:hypothetical protein
MAVVKYMTVVGKMTVGKKMAVVKKTTVPNKPTASLPNQQHNLSPFLPSSNYTSSQLNITSKLHTSLLLTDTYMSLSNVPFVETFSRPICFIYPFKTLLHTVLFISEQARVGGLGNSLLFVVGCEWWLVVE